MEKIYSLKELAEMLKVSERTLFRYLKSGELKGSKIGGWKFTSAEVSQFLKTRTNIQLPQSDE